MKFWRTLKKATEVLNGEGFTENEPSPVGYGMMRWPPLFRSAVIHDVPGHGNVTVKYIDCYGWCVSDNALAEIL